MDNVDDDQREHFYFYFLYGVNDRWEGKTRGEQTGLGKFETELNRVGKNELGIGGLT